MCSERELTIKRAEWLENVAGALVADHITPVAEHLGLTPAFGAMSYRISNAPIESRKKNKVLGRCHSRSYSHCGTNEIVINASIGENDSYLAVQVILHELIHAYDDCAKGHGGDFQRIAYGCGFQSPLETHNPSEALEVLAEDIVERFGFIPMGGMKDIPKAAKASRVKKLECSGCGFRANTSAKWLDQIMYEFAACPVCRDIGTLSQS